MNHPETMTVLRNGVEVIINKADFNPEREQMIGQQASAPMLPETDLSKMSATELRDYAKQNDIDVKGLKSRDDLYNAVVKPASEELFVIPNAEGKFIIITSDGQPITDEVYETQEDAEKALLGE